MACGCRTSIVVSHFQMPDSRPPTPVPMEAQAAPLPLSARLPDIAADDIDKHLREIRTATIEQTLASSLAVNGILVAGE